MEAMIDPRAQAVYTTALHEAAHALAADNLGRPVPLIRLALRPDGQGVDGVTVVTYEGLDETSDRIRLAVIFAGPVADNLFGSAEDDTEGDESDAAQLKLIAGRFGTRAVPEFLSATRRAERLVPMLLREIITLGRALADRPFMGGVTIIEDAELRQFLPGVRWSPWAARSLRG
jgi:hypothetical protein